MILKPFQNSVRLFWLIVLTDLLAIFLGFNWLHAIAKPLLMPCLVYIVYINDLAVPGKKLILIGLFFSWLGDLFLLIETNNALFFIAGLISFLITHICYIFYFLSIRSTQPSVLQKQPIYILLTLGYGVGLVWLLFPFLGVLKIPVILYAAIICSMLLCSIHIYLNVKAPANKLFIAGALLFVLSDSLLAINKFYHSFPFAGILIMLTYCAAQYLIVQGFIDTGKVRVSKA